MSLAVLGLQGALLLGATGCSPLAFAVKERAAARALAAADAEGAQEHAVYERLLSQRYLDKAREESAEAHYAWALSLLAQSEQSAVRARKLAEAGAHARAASGTPR
jgi:heme-degrading monooxygenase HmoA